MKIDSVDEKILSVCISWQTEAPLFAEFLLRFNYTKTEDIPTAGVYVKNHKLHLSYNQKFIDSLTMPQLKGLLVHEIMHILHKFQDRRGERDHKIFNISQDACINDTILKTRISGRLLELPPDGVMFDQIENMGYKGEIVSEPIYDFLYSKAKKIKIVSIGGGKSGQDGECDENQSQTKSGDKDEDGKTVLKTIDDHSGHENMTEMDSAAVDEIIKTARTRSWGSVSGNMQQKIEDLLKAKAIPWHQKLAHLLSRYINDPGNIYENNWSRRNRRGLPLPGIKKLSRKIIVTVDTSGSIADDDLKIFFFHIEKIIRDYSTLILIEWDTTVKSTVVYKKGDWKRIKINGRGGTNPQDLYDYVFQNYKSSIAMVNFTDGYFYWEFDHHNIPTIWALINNDNMVPSFGKYVHVVQE